MFVSIASEVARVEAEGTVLDHTAAAPHQVDPVLTQLGHGGRTAQLELALVADGRALATGGAPLVQVIAQNTHLDLVAWKKFHFLRCYLTNP